LKIIFIDIDSRHFSSSFFLCGFIISQLLLLFCDDITFLLLLIVYVSSPVRIAFFFVYCGSNFDIEVKQPRDVEESNGSRLFVDHTLFHFIAQLEQPQKYIQPFVSSSPVLFSKIFLDGLRKQLIRKYPLFFAVYLSRLRHFIDFSVDFLCM